MQKHKFTLAPCRIYREAATLIYRTIRGNVGLGAGWALLGFLYISEYDLTDYWRTYYGVNLAYAALVLVLGFLFGLFVFTQVAKHVLSAIEDRGVFEMTLRQLLYLIGFAVVMVVVVVWSVGTVPLSTLAYAMNFAAMIPAVGYFTQAAIFFRWQRKHNTVIFTQSGAFLGKIYPYPPLNHPTSASVNHATSPNST